jgi:hypothetical protein
MSNYQFTCDHYWMLTTEYTSDSKHEYMECANCGKTNPLGLFQTVDFSDEEYLTPVRADITRMDGAGWNINKGRSGTPL